MRPVNLVPQDQRRRTSSDGGGKSAHAALGVLALLLAMVVGYVLTSNTVTERQNETEAARVEADRLEAKAAQKGNFADFASIAQTRMQSVAGVAATRFDWERFMRELARVIPADSWLQSADASTTGVAAAARDRRCSTGPDGGARHGLSDRQPDGLHAQSVRRGALDGAATPAASRRGCRARLLHQGGGQHGRSRHRELRRGLQV